MLLWQFTVSSKRFMYIIYLSSFISSLILTHFMHKTTWFDAFFQDLYIYCHKVSILLMYLDIEFPSKLHKTMLKLWKSIIVVRIGKTFFWFHVTFWKAACSLFISEKTSVLAPKLGYTIFFIKGSFFFLFWNYHLKVPLWF